MAQKHSCIIISDLYSFIRKREGGKSSSVYVVVKRSNLLNVRLMWYVDIMCLGSCLHYDMQYLIEILSFHSHIIRLYFRCKYFKYVIVCFFVIICAYFMWFGYTFYTGNIINIVINGHILNITLNDKNNMWECKHDKSSFHTKLLYLW